MTGPNGRRIQLNRWPATVAALALLIAAPAEAEPNPPPPLSSEPASAQGSLEECVRAHLKSSGERDAGRLLYARAELHLCAREGCPIAVRAECRDWLEEAERQAPTVVFSVISPRGDRENVVIDLDGVRIAERLDGRPLEVEPGAHVFRFTTPDQPPVEVRTVIISGEKNRLLRVDFSPKPAETARPPQLAAIPPQPKAAPPTPPPHALPKARRHLPVTSIVLGSVALGLAATAAGFLATGISARNDAVDDCAPLCPRSRVTGTRRWFILADALGASAAAAGGAAVYVYLTQPTPMTTTVSNATWSLTLRGAF